MQSTIVVENTFVWLNLPAIKIVTVSGSYFALVFCVTQTRRRDECAVLVNGMFGPASKVRGLSCKRHARNSTQFVVHCSGEFEK
jgi:hypothetical protein